MVRLRTVLFHLVRGQATAQHFAAAKILAILVIDIMRPIETGQFRGLDIRIGDVSPVIELKGIETPRAPTDRVQGSLLDVVNDAAEVVLVSEYFCRLHRFGIDLVDDGRAVWPVFGNR